MSKKIISILFCAVLALCVSSCQKVFSGLTIDGQTFLYFEFPQEGGTKSIHMCSSDSWMSSYPDYREWVTITPKNSCAGQQEITLKIEPNDIGDRVAHIYFSWGSVVKEAEILVFQRGPVEEEK